MIFPLTGISLTATGTSTVSMSGSFGRALIWDVRNGGDQPAADGHRDQE